MRMGPWLILTQFKSQERMLSVQRLQKFKLFYLFTVIDSRQSPYLHTHSPGPQLESCAQYIRDRFIRFLIEKLL